MNTLDLKRKALGWMALAENAGTDGGMSGDGPNGSSSDNGSRGGSDSGGSGSEGGGWTGNRSERDARAEGNTAAGNPDGGPAGYGAEHGYTDPGYSNAVADRISQFALDNPQRAIDQNEVFGDLSRREAVNNDREVSPGGWTYGEVSSLSQQGFGGFTGVNANNTGQMVDSVMASKTMHDNVMPAVAGLITNMVPGAGLALAGMRAAGSVTSGQKSAADAMKDFAIDYGASKLAGMVNSKVAGVVGPENMANLGLASSVSKAFGGPGMPNIGASVVNGAMNVAGISKSTESGFASQNNPSADNGFTAPGTNYGGGDGGFTGVNAPSTPTTPTAQDVLSSSIDTNVNINLWGGMDGAGWKAAKANYINSKRK